VNAVTHIIRESVSPPEALTWTMWCGDQCVAFDDGTLAPEDIDFYHEVWAERADCEACKAAYQASKVLHVEAEER